MLSLLQILHLLYTQLNLQYYSFLTIYTNFEKQLIIFKSLKGFSIVTYAVFQKALLTCNKKHFNVFKSFFDSLLYGTCFLFKKLIRVKGVGSRFELKKTKKKQSLFLRIKAGYHKPLLFRYSLLRFKLKIPKNTRLIIKSTKWQDVYLFLNSIQKYRVPNPYTGKGMYFRYQRIIRKAVNKKK